MNVHFKPKAQLTEAPDQATDRLLSIVSEKSQSAQAELEHLICELQQLRQGMDDQGKRVQQQITAFASLGQSTLEFAKHVRDDSSNVKTLELRSEAGKDD
jgi:hypothetical protein